MKLKEIRQQLGKTQKQLVDRLHRIDPRVDVPLYSKMEAGLCLPTPPQLAEISDELGVGRSELYADEELFVKTEQLRRTAPATRRQRDPDLVTVSTEPDRPDSDGQSRTEQDAEGRRRDYHRFKHRICLRVNDAVWRAMPDLLAANGYTTTQAWLEDCLADLIAGKENAPAVSKTAEA